MTKRLYFQGETHMNDNLGILLRSQGILNRWRNALQLEENKQQEGERETSKDRRNDRDQDKSLEKLEDERRYIETRLREIRAWEKRISGNR